MEQEISLVEMTEQIIGKEAEFYTVWSWSHLCLLSLGCLIFFLPLLSLCSLFAVVNAFTPQGNLNRGTVIYGKAVPI
jgi:hypothetical protein